jgi:hypothetical protein
MRIVGLLYDAQTEDDIVAIVMSEQTTYSGRQVPVVDPRAFWRSHRIGSGGAAS